MFFFLYGQTEQCKHSVSNSHHLFWYNPHSRTWPTFLTTAEKLIQDEWHIIQATYLQWFAISFIYNFNNNFSQLVSIKVSVSIRSCKNKALLFRGYPESDPTVRVT